MLKDILDLSYLNTELVNNYNQPVQNLPVHILRENNIVYIK